MSIRTAYDRDFPKGALFWMDCIIRTCSVGRFLFFIFTAVALVASLSANGVSEQTVSEENTRVIIDVWNREVVIPEEVDSIAAIGSMGPRMAAYLDVVDMLVGAEDSDIRTMSVRYDYSPVYHDAMKNLPSIGTGGGSGITQNTEVTVTAEADKGYAFAGWFDAVTGEKLSDEASYTFTVTSNTALIAQFTKTEEPEPDEDISTAVLEYAIELAADVNTDGVMDVVKENFETALQNAKDIL